PQVGFQIKGRKLILSKVGDISIKLHRPIEGIVKTCTIQHDVDRWYACFAVELPGVGKIKPKTATGVDVGLESIVTLSTGEKVEPPKLLKRSEMKLTREQRRLSRKKKGSKNRSRQRLKVARAHRKVRNQRLDFTHKLSRDLVDRFDLVAFEDLRIRNMLKNHYLAKGIADASWHLLQSLTAYKAEWVGKHTAFAVANGTSQECSCCGETVKKSLAVRMHRCPHCNLTIDRDHNAAINILKRVGRDAPDLMTARGLPLGTPMKQEVPAFRPREDVTPKKKTSLTKFFDKADLGVDAINNWAEFEKRFYGG
ncbi:transposase, partial [archaeon]|nr:transposase [archaeon]